MVLPPGKQTKIFSNSPQNDYLFEGAHRSPKKIALFVSRFPSARLALFHPFFNIRFLIGCCMVNIDSALSNQRQQKLTRSIIVFGHLQREVEVPGADIRQFEDLPKSVQSKHHVQVDVGRVKRLDTLKIDKFQNCPIFSTSINKIQASWRKLPVFNAELITGGVWNYDSNSRAFGPRNLGFDLDRREIQCRFRILKIQIPHTPINH